MQAQGGAKTQIILCAHPIGPRRHETSHPNWIAHMIRFKANPEEKPAPKAAEKAAKSPAKAKASPEAKKGAATPKKDLLDLSDDDTDNKD